MKRRWDRVASALLVCAVLAGGCSRNPEPEPMDPEPDPPPAVDNSAAEAEAARREAEASRLCERAMTALDSGNYETARQLFRQVQRDYPETDCARGAAEQIEYADAMEAIVQRVHFEFDKSDITDEAARVLQRKADALRAFPGIRLTIEGHCDERGSLEYNRALGMRRAEASKAYLVTLGVEDARFRTVTYGEERPLDTMSNESAWARNRRGEFVIEGGA